MPRSSRQTARNNGYVLAVAIYRDESMYTRGGDALRGATGVRRDGSIVEMTDAWGNTFEYPPILDPGLQVPEYASLLPRSVSVTFPWLRTGVWPRDFDLRRAVGEVCLVDETGSGRTSVAYEKRWRLLYGPAKGPASWGDDESITITIQEVDVSASGCDFWGPGAELSGARHADIDADIATYPRAIAPSSKGVLTPIIYAPVGSSLRSPMTVVKDEVVPTFVARDFRISERPISTAITQFFLVDDKNDKQFTDTPTSTAYQAAPSVMTDLLNTKYYGVVGNFQQIIGTGVTFTNGVVDAIVPQQKDKLGAGDAVKGSASASDNHMEIIENISADAVTLQAVYTGTTQTTSGTAKAVLLPPTRADGAYRSAALGGTLNSATGTPICELIDVVIDWCTNYVRTAIPVNVGDLVALQKRCQGMRLGFYLNTRQDPWQRALKALEMIPIRPVREEGWIRFRWIGPVDPCEIVTTIDLDDDGISWRPGPVEWGTAPVFPIVEGKYGWDSLQGKYTGTLAIDGTAKDLTDPTRVPTGRAVNAAGEWRKGRVTDVIPRMPLDLDMVETQVTAAGALNTAMYLWGRARRTLELQLDASYRWLSVLDRVYLIEHKTIPYSLVWRIESRTIPGAGLWRYVLEECDGLPGSRTRQPLWAERDELAGYP